jgi:hypothetical protein
MVGEGAGQLRAEQVRVAVEAGQMGQGEQFITRGALKIESRAGP